MSYTVGSSDGLVSFPYGNTSDKYGFISKRYDKIAKTFVYMHDAYGIILSF
jgi:hypothetical protein